MNNKNALIAVFATAFLAAGCDRTDSHDQQVAADAARVQTPAPADAPIPSEDAPMSMVATAARISGVQHRTSDCNVEAANGENFEPATPSVDRAAQISITGWVIDAERGSVPDSPLLRIEAEDGSAAWEQPITEWNERGDVADAMGNEAFRESGFTVNVEAAGIPEGTYNVYLAYGDAGNEVACAVGRRLVLR